MSAQSETMAPAAAAPAVPAAHPFTRQFAWSLRRELWENRSVFLAPLAIGGVALLGSLLSLVTLQRRLTALQAANAKLAAGLMSAYAFSTAVILVTGLLVSFFYCVGALYGERRDRSILFWKSLPVSDSATVLAKATIPLAVVPLVTIATAYAAQLVTFVASTLVVAAGGFPLSLYWSHADLRVMAVMLPYGLFTLALWHAPIVGWLLMVSAWAKRTPILWVLGPPAVPAILEPIALGTHHVWDFLLDRLLGGGVVWTVHGDGKHTVQRFDQISGHVFLEPDIWVGLAFAALFLAGAIWLRRRREPV